MYSCTGCALRIASICKGLPVHVSDCAHLHIYYDSVTADGGRVPWGRGMPFVQKHHMGQIALVPSPWRPQVYEQLMPEDLLHSPHV